MKTRAAVAVKAGSPLEITEVDLETHGAQIAARLEDLGVPER